MNTHVERKLYFNSDQGFGIHVWIRFVNGTDQKGVAVGHWDHIPDDDEYVWLEDEESINRFDEYIRSINKL